MTTNPPDRLYALLPYVYRLRDGERGFPLRTFLRVIEDQVAVLETDLDRLYDNWFIETCDESIVPYIGELVGWTITARAGEPGAVQSAEGMQLRRTLAPRADVARTLAHRRRKGTFPLLEELARSVAGWPAHAVEFYRLLSVTQALNHLRLERGRTVDLGDGDALARLGGPFESTAHTAELRRPTSSHGRGRYNVPSTGVFAWRLRAWSVTECQAYLQEGVVDRELRRRGTTERQRGCFHCNVLGFDTPLFLRPEAETDPAAISQIHNVPARLTRRLLAADLARYYGPDRSVCIWLGTNRPGPRPEPVPVEQVMVADLTEWAYTIPDGKTVLLDPELGRFKVRLAIDPGARPTAEDMIGGARVTYHHGFSAAIGGGEYDRDLVGPTEPHCVYVVGRGPRQLPTLAAALERWRDDAPDRAIIEIATRDVQRGPVRVELRERQVLILRAADRHRAVLRLLDDRADARDDFVVVGARGSRFVCDGFLVTGRGVSVSGPLAEVVFRHCTLPPVRAERGSGSPPASLILDVVGGDVAIERSIVGAIAVTHDSEPTRLAITGSIVDAGGDDDNAISDGPAGRHARAQLTIRATTVFGRVTTHALALAENTIFSGLVRVARRFPGCVRFCHVPLGSRTPRRFECQPDLAIDALPPGDTEARAAEADRVWPVWTSRRYGDPAYAQLWRDAPREIARGADDEGEIGALHDLFWPQRDDALAERLTEYAPAGGDAGLFFVT